MDYLPHQIIQLGAVTIQVWGLCFALAVSSGIVWAFYRTPPQLRDHILNLGIISILAGIVGARLAFIIFYPHYFNRLTDLLRVWEGGMVSYGGLVLAIFFSFIYLRKKKLSIYQFADIFAPPLALSITITRIGCFLNHCHLGKLTEVPWGLQFAGETRHPIALYYSLSAWLILIILLIMEKRYQLQRGSLALTLGLLYPLFRLIADQFADYQFSTIAVINNIFLILLFLTFLILIKRKKAKTGRG
jgi:phosphatidylglycerol---prolipoprotein diacylglyceryl transferase